MTSLPRLCGLWFFLVLIAMLPLAAGEKSTLDIVHTLKGHGAEVYSVAFSPDGKLLVTGSFDNTLKLWDVASGKEVKTYAGPQGHTKQVLSVAFSPDGQFIASGGADNMLKIWDVPVSRPIRSLPLGDGVLAVALNADSTRLATGSQDGKVGLYNAADFKELAKLEPGHAGAITSLAFSANGQVLVSGGADQMLRFWNATNGQLIAAIGAHLGPVNSVAIHPANAAVYSVGDDGLLKFWPLTPPGSRSLPAHAGAVQALAIAGDNLFTGGDDKVVRHSNAGKEIRALSGSPAPVRSLAVNNAGTLLAAGTTDGQVNIWNTGDGKPAGSFLAHAGTVSGLSFHPTNPQLASFGPDGVVKIWAMPTAPVRVLAHPEAVQVALAAGDGKIYTGGMDKIVRVWDAAKLAVERQFAGHAGPVTALAAAGQTLVSGGGEGAIRFWNLAAGKEAETLIGPASPVSSLQLNQAGNLLLSACEDGSVRLWQLPITPPKVMVHPDQVTCLALTADAGKMITGCGDKQVRLWNLASGAKERDFAGPTLPVTCVAVTPDGQLIAAGSADKLLTLWSVDGKALQKAALSAPVQALALSPDGKVAACGLADGNLQLVGTGDGKDIKILTLHKGATNDVIYAPKGDLLISASADKTIQIVNVGDLQPRGKLDHVGPVTALAISRDGSQLAALAESAVKVWTLADNKEVASFGLPAPAKRIAFSPDGTRLAAAGADNLTRVFELNGQLVESFPHEGPVQAVAFIDAKRLVSAGADKTARLWSSSVLWQRRHTGAVRAAVFSAKGDQVLSAGDDKTVKTWNTADGKEVRTLAAHEGAVLGLAVSADGGRLITAGADKTAKVWNLQAKPEDTKPLAVLPLPAVPTALALNQAGTRLAVAGQDKQVTVFDPGLGQLVQVLTDHSEPVRSLAFLGDNRTLLSAAADKTARLADVNVLGAFEAHKEGIVSLQYHGSGTQLLTAGKDKTLKLWDLAKNTALRTFGPFPENISQATYSRDFTLVGAAVGQQVKVWNAADGKEVVTLQHPVAVLSLSFNQDKTRLATAADKRTRLWDIATGRELQFFPQDDAVTQVQVDAKGGIVSAAGPAPRYDTPSILRVIEADKGPVRGLATVPAGTHVLTGGADQTVKMWNVSSGANERTFKGTAPIGAVAVNKAGQLVAAAGADQVVHVYNLADAKEQGSVKSLAPVHALTFTPNNLVLAAACADKTLLAWNVPFQPGQPPAPDFLSSVQSFQADAVLRDLTFAGDSATLYSAGMDKNVHVWKLASPNPVRNLPHPTIVDAVAFQPGGGLVGTGGHDGKIRLVDFAKGAVVKEIGAHMLKDALSIYCVTFTPDGKQVLSSGQDGSLKLFDVGSGNLVREFRAYKVKEFEQGHQDTVFSAAFSPDGKLLASGSGGLERVIKIWNVADGSVIRELANPNIKAAGPVQSHPSWVYQLRFSSDGKLISIGDAPLHKGFLGVWNPQEGKLLYGATVPMGCFFGLDVSRDGTLLAIGAGPRGRPTPEFNSAYVIRMPVK